MVSLKSHVVQAGLAGIFLVGIYAVISGQDSSEVSPQVNEKTESVQAPQTFEAENKDSSGASSAGKVSRQKQPPSDEVALKSLKYQATVLKGFYRARNPVRPLMDYLEKAGQTPVLTRNYNDETGELVIVRTNTPAPGTRYFHTQAFRDENGVQFIQHMSFEFKPGERSMSAAKSTLQETFQVEKPDMETSEFVQWQLPDGYTLWMKKLNKEDIADMAEDEFNAYSPEDVGAIRVAIEQNPHEGH